MRKPGSDSTPCRAACTCGATQCRWSMKSKAAPGSCVCGFEKDRPDGFGPATCHRWTVPFDLRCSGAIILRYWPTAFLPCRHCSAARRRSLPANTGMAAPGGGEASADPGRRLAAAVGGPAAPDADYTCFIVHPDRGWTSEYRTTLFTGRKPPGLPPRIFNYARHSVIAVHAGGLLSIG